MDGPCGISRYHITKHAHPIPILEAFELNRYINNMSKRAKKLKISLWCFFFERAKRNCDHLQAIVYLFKTSHDFQYASKELECLKNAMEDLSKLQGELAEFFCEDPKSFRIEECFKAFQQFINNFKKALIDNDKRKEQEKTAEQRRQQRETEQAKRRSGSFQGETSELFSSAKSLRVCPLFCSHLLDTC